MQKAVCKLVPQCHLDAIFPPLKWGQHCLMGGITLQRRKTKLEPNPCSESFASFSEQLCVSALPVNCQYGCLLAKQWGKSVRKIKEGDVHTDWKMVNKLAPPDKIFLPAYKINPLFRALKTLNFHSWRLFFSDLNKYVLILLISTRNMAANTIF